MAAFKSSLWVPNYSSDIVRGNTRAAIMIQTLADYSAVYSGAEWDLLSMFTQVDVEEGSQGGGSSPLNIRLCHGPQHTLDDTAVSTALLTRTLKFTTVRDSVVIDEFLDTVKGNRYFIVWLRGVKGTTKRVFFSYGYWDIAGSASLTYDAANQRQLSFIAQAHGLASAPTIPALPANTDAAFTTGAMQMEYLGWLLGSADSAKGGFGTAVSLPTTVQLHSAKVGITLDF